MNKYIRILKSFNISALFISAFFALFLSIFVEYSRFYFIFFLSSLAYTINIWLFKKEKHDLAYLIFMATNCGLLLLFDAGVHGPTHTYIFYIPLLLCNFIVINPKNNTTRIFTLLLTFSCLAITTFFDFTPKLSKYLFTPAHQDIVIYFNIITAIVMTIIMMEVIIRNTNTAEAELIKQKDALINKEQLLHSINQNISEGIYRSTEDNRLIYVNNAFVSLFGYDSTEEVLNLNSMRLYDDPGQRVELAKLIKLHGFFNNREILFSRKDGTKFWGLVSSILTHDAHGTMFFDGAIRDITEIKNIEEEMLQAKNQAEFASKAKSNFLSAMSHEIRTPLNAVVGITNLLLLSNNQKGNNTDTENLNVLKSSAQNLMNLLNDILDFNKIEAGKFNILPSYNSLKEEINDLITMYSFHAKQKGIQFLFDIKVNEYEYLVDSIRLTQILSNLLSNAVKFTETGFVKLIIKSDNPYGDYSNLSFLVEDSGIGIDKEYQKIIFDAFTQENESTANLYGGSGLGLTISRSILRKMDSEFILKSEKGKGTLISFNLNCKCRKPAMFIANGKNKDDDRSLNGMKILLAEDNYVNVSIARQLLNIWNAEVQVAKNGIEAVEMAKTNQYDIILMDIHMPLLNGFEATERLRNAGINYPIFALTADALTESRESCLAAGMNDFITKPFHPQDLYNKLKACHSN